MLNIRALDSTLARQIVHWISFGKRRDTRRLESPQLPVYGGAFFGESNVHWPLDANGLVEVIDRIGKLWKDNRNPRDEILVDEIAKSRNIEWLFNSNRVRDDPAKMTEQMELIFRRLWLGIST